MKLKILRKNKKDIIRKYEIGYSSHALAKDYGVSDNLILNVLKENNITIRGTHPTKKQRNQYIVDIIFNLLKQREQGAQFKSNTILKMLLDKKIGNANNYCSRSISNLLKHDDRFNYTKDDRKQGLFSIKEEFF